MNSSNKPFLRSALIFLFLGGLTVMLWPAGQTAYGWWSQRSLRADWEKASHQKPMAPMAHTQITSHKSTKRTSSNIHANDKLQPDKKPRSVTKHVPLPPTRIVIPDIHVDAVVVQGMEDSALQCGPGHDPNSALPGESGNCVLAAHSNIFGAWFGDLDQLWAGSIIELHTPRHTYVYSVLTSNQVPQTDTSVLNSTDDGLARLTLITCTKPASTYRHVVTALLDETK